MSLSSNSNLVEVTSNTNIALRMTSDSEIIIQKDNKPLNKSENTLHHTDCQLELCEQTEYNTSNNYMIQQNDSHLKQFGNHPSNITLLKESTIPSLYMDPEQTLLTRSVVSNTNHTNLYYNCTYPPHHHCRDPGDIVQRETFEKFKCDKSSFTYPTMFVSPLDMFPQSVDDHTVKQPLFLYKYTHRVTAMSKTKQQCLKTKLCHFFLEQKCSRGSNCLFAHSSKELRLTPDLSKTKICVKWRKGSCFNESKQCNYAHGIDDLRHSSTEQTQSVKSEDDDPHNLQSFVRIDPCIDEYPEKLTDSELRSRISSTLVDSYKASSKRLNNHTNPLSKIQTKIDKKDKRQQYKKESRSEINQSEYSNESNIITNSQGKTKIINEDTMLHSNNNTDTCLLTKNTYVSNTHNTYDDPQNNNIYTEKKNFLINHTNILHPVLNGIPIVSIPYKTSSTQESLIANHCPDSLPSTSPSECDEDIISENNLLFQNNINPIHTDQTCIPTNHLISLSSGTEYATINYGSGAFNHHLQSLYSINNLTNCVSIIPSHNYQTSQQFYTNSLIENNVHSIKSQCLTHGPSMLSMNLDDHITTSNPLNSICTLSTGLSNVLHQSGYIVPMLLTPTITSNLPPVLLNTAPPCCDSVLQMVNVTPQDLLQAMPCKYEE